MHSPHVQRSAQRRPSGAMRRVRAGPVSDRPCAQRDGRYPLAPWAHTCSTGAFAGRVSQDSSRTWSGGSIGSCSSRSSRSP